MRTATAVAVLLLALAPLACLPSLGPFRLEAARGRLIDGESGAALPGAEVVQWYRGAGRGGGPQPVYHARWTRTDDDGAFDFPSAVAPSLRMWLLRTYDPTYGFFHPRYGLQRGGPSSEGEVLLRGSLANAEQALADLAAWCRDDRDEPGARHLREIACAARPARGADARSD